MPVKRKQKKEAVKPLWEDEDDEQLEVSIPTKVKKTFQVDLKRTNDVDEETLQTKEYIGRLQEAFKRRHGGKPKWAETEETAEDDDSLLRTASGYIEKDTKLSKTTIHTTLLKDFNTGHRSSKAITVVKFHKTRPVLITGDSGGNVKLYKVSSEVRQDNFLQSVHFQKFPIERMEIAQQGHAVICSSTSQEYLMQYDMEKGNVTQLRMPKTVPKQGISLFAISHDSEYLAVAGVNSHVYILQTSSMEHIKTISLPANATDIRFFPGVSREIWIMCENGQCIMSDVEGNSQHNFVDDGAVHGTCLAISQHGEYFATGSDTGIVNVYDGSSCRQKAEPKPLFNIDNLVTKVSAAAFNSDAQLLAICSNVKDNQIRLIHTQSQTVFKNFPDRHGHVSKANCLDISPKGGYLAVGNNDGKLHVFHIHHFSQY
ncbi:unnamed protein product [Caenorhabditis angaria]|uniref:Anaphase-promoting complex subunit 4-like WD40 domain-containing protein n=1 Tax=Caenorhabditis angaria TaxID=860376 RepID=A0A9P1IKH7_9PELO|nr:unnamed protein product [Caenorhabditis angaria]